MGTSGWVAVTEPREEALGRTGAFVLEHPTERGLAISAASTMTAGGALDWARQAFRPAGEAPAEEHYARICALAAESEPGSRGVMYLPWLGGERSPFLDPDARGGFLGLSLASTQADMFRAMLEGVAYAYRSLLEVVAPGHARGRGAAVLVAGGPTKSPLWMQAGSARALLGRSWWRSPAAATRCALG
ncbi:unnamed protein product, partial [Prorocentrum cordatum]